MKTELAALAGKRALVTGANGFIGSHLCRALAAAGAQVHAVSRSPKRGDPTTHWWQGNLAEFAPAEHIFAQTRPDYIFHLAGIAAGSRDMSLVLPTLESNLLSTVNMLVLSKRYGCSRFILPGSMEEPDALDAGAIPSSPYAASKWAATMYTKMFQTLYEVPTVILRIFMVYGPSRQDLNKLIPHVILALLRGEVPSLGSGQRRIDWVYIRDVTEALLKAAVAEGVVGRTLDIGSGRAISVRELVAELVDIVDPALQVNFGGLPDRVLEQERVADTDQTLKWMHWEPRTSLREGLVETVAWYRDLVTAGDLELSS